MIELTRCGAPDNDRYLPAVMTQGDASTYQTMLVAQRGLYEPDKGA